MAGGRAGTKKLSRKLESTKTIEKEIKMKKIISF